MISLGREPKVPRKSVNSVTLTGLLKTISGQNNRLNRLSSLSKSVINVKKMLSDIGTSHRFVFMEEVIVTTKPHNIDENPRFKSCYTCLP